MRIVVCGGRDFNDYDLARQWVAGLDRDKVMVAHGGCRGADQIVAELCQFAAVPVVAFLARWHTEGKLAGPIRNQRMLEIVEPDLVVAFPGGRGTADMVRRAKESGVKVVEL